MTNTAEKTKIEVNHSLAEPPQFSVIYVNDDKTTLEFVVDTLIAVFGHDVDTAETIAVHVHENGSGVAAVLPYELAEQKTMEVIALARMHNFPLVVKVEAK